MRLAKLAAFAAAVALPAAASAQEELSIGAIYLDAQGYYAGVRAGINERAQDLGRTVNVIETNARGDERHPSEEVG